MAFEPDQVPRIVVVQPARPPEQPSSWLSVGVYRWWGPDPQLAIVAKATFTYAPRAGALPEQESVRLAGSPAPMSLDEIHPVVDGELRYASDFVPRKAHPEVLLSGHAFAAGGSTESGPTEIDCELQVGAMRRDFAVRWDEPGPAVPLCPDYVVGSGGVDLRRVGPRAVTVDPQRSHDDSFDFAAYNAAPRSQWCERIAPDGEILLVGLSRHGPRRRLKLPGLSARVAVELPADPELLPVAMVLDTLWIDTDLETMAVAWRGALPVRNDGSEICRILASLEPHEAPRTSKEQRARLPRGRAAYALRTVDLLPGAEPVPTDDATLEAARLDMALDGPGEPQLELEQYAQIAAEVADADSAEARAEVLDRHDFDESRWALEERAWLDKMGNEAMDGDVGLAQRYSVAFCAAQDALATPAERERTVLDLAAILVEMESSPDPLAVLGERRISLAQFMRLQRRLTAEQKAEPDKARQLQEEMDRLRKLRPAPAVEPTV
ncbi:MAG: DUF2169 domain-containing protein [Deltaproteobacteria bacterium]|jgi:hypothetical protein|nr:DUF2169 domain-containing protein [Deltaproteobacteria bacterium]MBW2533384.1 DUF2169 domain-containing protein [Deltaproteobacteria bacterium]